MENSATSRISSYDGDDRCEATLFNEDSSWSSSSSMDDLLMFDVHSSRNHSSSSSYEYFQTRLRNSSAVNCGAQPSASSFRLKRRKMAVDDDLEDTATSPPHPSIVPKMGELSSKQNQIKQREMINQTKHKGKGNEDYGEVEDRIIEGGNFVGRDNNINKNCSIGLKNIGLCIVPLSMALNYFA